MTLKKRIGLLLDKALRKLKLLKGRPNINVDTSTTQERLDFETVNFGTDPPGEIDWTIERMGEDWASDLKLTHVQTGKEWILRPDEGDVFAISADDEPDP